MQDYCKKGKELLRSRGKRYLSLLLSVVLMLSLIPVMRTDADAAVTITGNANGEYFYTDTSTGNVYKVSSDKAALALLNKSVDQYLHAGYTMDLVSSGGSTTGGGTTGGGTTGGTTTGGGTTSTETHNYYALQVVTGNSAGDKVQYFAVHYKDASGIQRTELIYPNAGALQKSYNIAKKVGTDTAQTKYDTMTKIGYASYLKNGVDTSKVNGLQIGKTDTFLFEPKFAFDELVGVDILMRYDSKNTGNKGWSCGGLEVYKVNSITGLDMISYYGSDIMINYEGQMLGRALFNGSSFTYDCGSKADAIYRLRVLPSSGGTNASGTVQKKEGCSFEVYDAETSAKKVYNTNKMMMIGIDLADIYGAGVEGLICNTQVKSAKGIYESIVARVSYTDVNGFIRTVDVPVTLSMLCYMNINGMGDKIVYDIAQQGEKLFAPLFTPGIDMSKTPKITLYFGAKQAAEMCGLNDATNKGDEYLRVAGVQIYDEVGTIITNYYQIAVKDVGTPRWFFTASSAEGVNVIAGNDNNFVLSEYDSMFSNLTPIDNATRYLVEMTADTPAASGTKDDVIVEFTYEASSGNKKTIKTVVRNAVNDFYGEWMATNNSKAAYNIKMSAGQTARFFITANDVKQFVSAKISLAEGKTDDYQINSLKIYPVNYKGTRVIKNVTANYSDPYPSWWTIDRNTETGSPVVNFSGEKVLVYKGSPQLIEFGKTSSTVVPTNDVDWNDFRVSMSYSDAVKDMGYTDIRTTYEVTVQVGSDSGELTDNGDTGSENMFYFQLVFEDGSTSAYVLANQLIPSGRFRSGKPESFKICMNYDYGDIKTVRLIPDDTIEQGEVFDKLYIEKITVAKQSTSEHISKTWSCDVNEWIDIDYVDTGAQNSLSGQAGRSEGQLARSYSITTQSYITNFVFSVTTIGTGGDETGGKDYYATMQGYMFAEISYMDRDGMFCSKTIDVYEAMREYRDLESMGKSSSLPEKVGKLASGASGGEKINNNYMLKKGATDRFIVALDGVASFNSITFYVSSPEYLCRWKFGPVVVYNIISGDGRVIINDLNQREKNFELIERDRSTADYYVVDSPSSGTAQESYVGFEGNDIPINEEECTWNTLIGREPDSLEDELNIYIYMKGKLNDKGETGSPITSYNMNVAAYYDYSDKYGGLYTDGVNSYSKMGRSTDKNVFYVTGLKTPGISSLKGVKMQAMDLNNPNKIADNSINPYVEKVVVDQVRSGVVINTFYYTFDGLKGKANGAGPLIATPETSSKSTETKEKQVVYLQFGEGTEVFYPSQGADGSELNDVAIALEYHTSNMISNTTTVRTKNIFLSDVYSGQKISAGDVVKLTFNAENLDSITGIQLAYMGAVTATVSGASVGAYDAAGNESWYGTMNSKVITLTGTTAVTQMYSAAKGGRVPVTFTIKTADAEAGAVASGCSDPIYTEIHYQDPNGSERVFTAADLNNYVASGSFAAGATAVVPLLLPNLGSLHYVEFEPTYSADAHTAAATSDGDTASEAIASQTASWKIGSVTAEIGEAGSTTKREDCPVNKAVYEDNPYRVNLSTMKIAASIKAAKAADAVETIGEGKEILVSSGESVTITRCDGKDALISGSFKDVTVTAEEVVDNAVKDVSSLLSTTTGHNNTGKTVISSIVFNTPSNTGTTVKNYRITISSEEIPDMKLEIKISVKSASS